MPLVIRKILEMIVSDKHCLSWFRIYEMSAKTFGIALFVLISVLVSKCLHNRMKTVSEHLVD